MITRQELHGRYCLLRYSGDIGATAVLRTTTYMHNISGSGREIKER